MLMTVVLATTLVATLVLYLMFQVQFQYWKKRSVPYKKPMFFFGNFFKVYFFKNTGTIMHEIYKETKKEKFYGIYSFYKPNLIINDSELARKILVSDFQYFHDRGVYVDDVGDPLSAHLFALSGTQWKNLRVKLTPTFSSGKMKMMFHTIVQVSENLQRYLQKPAQHNEVLEIKDIMARFTTDIIASTAFGLELNSLEHPDLEFRKMGRRMLELPWWQAVKVGMCFYMPEVAAFFKIRQTHKEVAEFFLSAVEETIRCREENNITRNDFLQLLIQLKNKGFVVNDSENRQLEGDGAVQGIDKRFTVLNAAAQAFVFFIAGFETSSTTIQFALYELALNHDIQERVRSEVDSVLARHDGKLTYEGMMEMQYLDMVVSETLRKYPPILLAMRECTKPYKMPDSHLILEKGVVVQIPILGFHMDPDYFPNPDKFEPQRFTEEEKSKRHHHAYIPFGDGPRICIGNRFGLMQTKAGLAAVLSKYKVSVCKQTPIPLVYEPTSFLLSPKGGMHLQISNRS